MKKSGFTLIEMLVVIGIIAVLAASLVGAYSHMTKAAEKARCQELVHNTATALTALFQEEGVWPKRLRNATASNNGGKLLDKRAGYALIKYMALKTNGAELGGYDRLGVVSPWATAVIKRRSSASESETVPSGGKIQDHILRFEIDLDGDGIIEANVGGENVSVRATAIVWCCGKDGKLEDYSTGRKRDDVYSWTYGQTQSVK